MTRPFLLAFLFGSALVACGAPPLATTPDAPSLSAPPTTDAPPAAEAKPAPPPPATASAPSSPAAPISSASSSAPSAPAPVLALTQGKIPEAARDLAAADAKVRACFAKAKTPPQKGELSVKITISTTGFTLNADAKPSGDVSKETASCAKAALRDLSWGKPEGGGVAAAAGTFVAPSP